MFVAVCGVVALMVGAAAAKDKTRITFVQAHSNTGVGEEVFIYAVPKYFGWFEEEGLEVDIRGVRGGTLAAQVLESGDAQIVSTDPAVVMSVREKGGTAKVFYALRRQGGYAIATLADSPIAKLEDLKGKTIGAASLASGVVPIFTGMMSDLGFDKSDYTIVAAGTGGQAATALSTGNVDALILWDSVYAVIENLGVKLKTFDFPVIPKLAGFSLASTDKYIADHADVLTGFCRAVSKGIVFAKANPEAAIRIFFDVFPETKPAEMTDKTVSDDAHILTNWMANGTGSEEGVPLGWSYPEKWKYSYKYYQDNGRIAKPAPLEDHYTNSLIDSCNSFDKQPIIDKAKSMP
jgi:NitT/TauT family transport system substrate-binding protein